MIQSRTFCANPGIWYAARRVCKKIATALPDPYLLFENALASNGMLQNKSRFCEEATKKDLNAVLHFSLSIKAGHVHASLIELHCLPTTRDHLVVSHEPSFKVEEQCKN